MSFKNGIFVSAISLGKKEIMSFKVAKKRIKNKFLSSF